MTRHPAYGANPGRPGVRSLLPITLASALCCVATVWAMTIGSTPLSAVEIARALIWFDGTSREHIVIASVRLPRVLAGLLAGSALAVSGAIMQGITNNPLASPGLLGINAGAAFAVVMSIVFAGVQSTSGHMWAAFAGAAGAACTVYGLGSFGRGGVTPLKLAIAGAMLGSFLGALTTAVLIFDQSTLDEIRLWATGSLAGRTMAACLAVAPYTLFGLIASFFIGRQVTTLSLGSDVSRALGQKAGIWRFLAAMLVMILAGSAVALAGPLGFVGLVVPHIARFLVGVDYRLIIPFCVPAGGLLVVVADGVARAIMSGEGIPVGTTMALLGAPFFIYLARYRIGGGR